MENGVFRLTMKGCLFPTVSSVNFLKRNPKARNEHFIEEKRNVPYNYRRGEFPCPSPRWTRVTCPYMVFACICFSLFIENIYKNKRMRLCPNRCANSAANACVRCMREQGIEALLISHAANRYYLSGFELHDVQLNESAAA